VQQTTVKLVAMVNHFTQIMPSNWNIIMSTIWANNDVEIECSIWENVVA